MNDSFYQSFGNQYPVLDEFCPDYLYHYTSIESLEQILKSEKFLFKRIDLLNDNLEGETEPGGDSFSERELESEQRKKVRKSTYVSCWTMNEQGVKGLWEKYAGSSGVRIKLPSHMFHMSLCKEEVSIHGRERHEVQVGEITSNNKEKPLHYQRFLLRADGVERVVFDAHPIQIVYHDSYKPQIYKKYKADTGRGCSDFYTTNWKEVARIKKRCWELEQEWRFRVFLMNEQGLFVEGEKLRRHKDENVTICPNTLYIQFDPDSFKGAEILLGPKCTPEQKNKVKSFLKGITKDIKQSKI